MTGANMPPVTSKEDFGQALRRIRLARGLAQEQAALAAGVSETALNRAETGKSYPTGETLLSVLDALGASMHDLARSVDVVEGRSSTDAAGTPRAAWVSVLVRHGVDPRALEGAAADALASGDPKAEADLFASAEEAARQLTAAAVAELRRAATRLAEKE